MFNKVIFIGNLTRDIELKYSNGGSAIANTAIATTRKFTVNGEKKEETCFVDITFFGRSAEVANQYLHKGSKLLVEGRLKFDQWTAQDGSKRSKHSVSVESMEMLDSRSDTASHNQSQQTQQEYNNSATQSFQGTPQYQAQYENMPDRYNPNLQNTQPASQPSYRPQNTIPEYDIDDESELEIPF